MVLAGVKSRPRTPRDGDLNLALAQFRDSYEITSPNTPDDIKHLTAAYPAHESPRILNAHAAE